MRDVTMGFMREDAARSARHAEYTEGLSAYDKACVEQLLDNYESFVREDTTTGGVVPFSTVARPLVRRVHVDSIASQIVAVVPMTQPVEKMFFLDFLYDQTLAPTVAGDRTDFQANKTNALYAAGMVRGEILGTGNGVITAFQTKLWPFNAATAVVSVNAVPVAATINAVTGAITTSVAPAAAAVVTVDYDLLLEGLGAAGNAQIPTLRMGMSDATITATSRKLAVEYTLEASQDFRFYHGLNAGAELAVHMGREMTFEKDRFIINQLLAAASATNINWSKTVPANWTQRDWFETLMHAVTDASNAIYKKRLRWANFVVMGPDTSTRLGKVNAIRLLNPENVAQTISQGPNVFGTLAGAYKVIVDPLFPADKILVGFKGETLQDTGYLHGPLISFETEEFLNPKTQKVVKSLLSRDSNHLVSGDFYATVTLTA